MSTAHLLTPTLTADMLAEFLRPIYGPQAGHLAILSLPRGEGQGHERQQFYAYPQRIAAAAAWLRDENAAGRDVYICAHALATPQRRKANALPLWALYADLDHDRLPASVPPPSLIVETSPGRWQAWWFLSSPVLPARGETLNKRLAIAAGADMSGWDLGQLLRPPGTVNRKRTPDMSSVRTVHEGGDVYDPDDLDRILPPLPPSHAPRSVIQTSNDGDEPPVRLSPAALEVYRGKRFKTKPHAAGEIDRSDSLYWIACELEEAGATGPTIAAALAERDCALGWEKYSGRSDASEQYAAITDKVLARPRRSTPSLPPLAVPAPTLPPIASSGDPCADRIVVLQTEIAALQAQLAAKDIEITELRRTQAAIIATVTNPHLKAEAVTVIRLAADLERQHKQAPTSDGLYRVSAARLGDEARKDVNGNATGDPPIRGRATVSRHLDTLDELGPLERQRRQGLAQKQVKHPVTGEIRVTTLPVEESWIRYPGSMAEFLTPFAHLRREKPTNHGGKRIPCPQCGSTKRTVLCADCGLDLTTATAVVADGPASVPRVSQDETHKNEIQDIPVRPPAVVPYLVSQLETAAPVTAAFLTGAAFPTAKGPPGESPGRDRWTS